MPSVAELLVRRVRHDYAREGGMALDAGGDVHSTPVHVAILAEDDVPEMDSHSQGNARFNDFIQIGERVLYSVSRVDGGV